MNDYLQSIIDRDPAAKSKLSLILTYPGVKAIFFHKIAHFFSTAKFSTSLILSIISLKLMVFNLSNMINTNKYI